MVIFVTIYYSMLHKKITMPSILAEGLTLGAWIAIGTTIFCNLYLFYRRYTDPKPLSFLELFLYMENHMEDLRKKIESETDDIKKEVLQSELRNYDRIRRKFEELKP